MKFTLKQLFSLFDGRLSTEIGDVYKMLDHITGEELMTHHLPTAFTFVKDKNLKWFTDGVAKIDTIKKKLNTNDFNVLMEYIDKNNEIIDVPKLNKKEKEGFGAFMIDNSLLNKIGSKKNQ